MRIPSQFNEDNLYRRRPRPGDLNPQRRLLHLVLALALVVVLMNQAAKPQIYESFFAALAADSQGELIDFPATTAAGDSATLSNGPAADSLTAAELEIVAKVADGSVWQNGDFPALYLFLSHSDRYAFHSGAVVGVVPLLQQAEVFRNRRVRCRGRVVRCQRIEATQNEFAIEQYWQLWLRPSSGAERPVVVIASAVPEVVAQVGDTDLDRNGPDILVSGRYLKRLAYQSHAGADLAPVIVGKVALRSFAAPIEPSPANTTSGTTLGIVVVIAVIGGVSLAALVMWRSELAARQMRNLRSPRKIEL